MKFTAGCDYLTLPQDSILLLSRSAWGDRFCLQHIPSLSRYPLINLYTLRSSIRGIVLPVLYTTAAVVTLRPPSYGSPYQLTCGV